MTTPGDVRKASNPSEKAKELLEEIFRRFGPVRQCTPHHADGAGSRCWCEVTFEDASSAQACFDEGQTTYGISADGARFRVEWHRDPQHADMMRLSSMSEAPTPEPHPALSRETARRSLRPDVKDNFRDDIDLDYQRLIQWHVTDPFVELWEYVGMGAYGKVYVIRFVAPPIEVSGRRFDRVAVKVPRPEGVAELKREVEQLAKLEHCNIVMILGMSQGPAPDVAQAWIMCLEFCESDLRYLLHSREAKHKDIYELYSVDRMVKFAQGIANGLAYCHGERVLHLDIKSENILLAKEAGEWVPKLSDFGMQHSDVKDRAVGSWEYMSPECFSRKHGQPSEKSDVFSVGLLLFEMFSRARVYTAFPGVDEMVDVLHQAETGERRADVRAVAVRLAHGQRPEMSALEGCHVVMHKLMQACWAHDIEARPTAKEVLRVLDSAVDTKGAFIFVMKGQEMESPEPSYDDFLSELNLHGKKTDLADFLKPGSELVELKQMDEEDVTADILDDIDLGLSEAIKKEFLAAVRRLKDDDEIAANPSEATALGQQGTPEAGGSPAATGSREQQSSTAVSTAAWAWLEEKFGSPDEMKIANLEAQLEEQKQLLNQMDEELQGLRGGTSQTNPSTGS